MKEKHSNIAITTLATSISVISIFTFHTRTEFVLEDGFKREAEFIKNTTIGTIIPGGCETKSEVGSSGFYNSNNFHSIDLKSDSPPEFISIQVKSHSDDSNPKIYLKSQDGTINNCWDLNSTSVENSPTLESIPGNKNYKMWIGDSQNLNDVSYTLIIYEQH